MDDELRKAIADFFDAGDFAEFIGITTEQIIEAFPNEVEDALDDILELMRYKKPAIMEGEEE